MTAFVACFTGFSAINYQWFFDVVNERNVWQAIHWELLIQRQRLKTNLGYVSLVKTTKAQPEMWNITVFFFFFPRWKTFMRFPVHKLTCWGGCSAESECQMDPWVNLINSFGLKIFWCWTFLELFGCLTEYTWLAKAMKNIMIWTDWWYLKFIIRRDKRNSPTHL